MVGTDFSSKDFEWLHKSKIRDGLTTISNNRVSSEYFFCVDVRMIFIKRSRKFYKIMASSQCNFEPCYHESVLDVLYQSTDLNETVNMFLSYVLRLIKKVE